MDDIRLTQQSFARKALAEPQHRFDDLYHLICRRDWIAMALGHVLSNKGSRTAGVAQRAATNCSPPVISVVSPNTSVTWCG